MSHSPDDPLLNVDQVAEWLGKPSSWVHKNWAKLFPEVTRVGRELRWKRSVIARYLDTHTAGFLDVR